jgi:hypothetical protein
VHVYSQITFILLVYQNHYLARLATDACMNQFVGGLVRIWYKYSPLMLIWIGRVTMILLFL